ncbi:MAG: NADH:ubiquinone oxidoreductase subunit NDUFA12 [Alphaproteobacteria bacterium]|nr:MAG: NADH:ubiquinone oxidoreductase subunit NDUFA12 [Alphaproteobacteria bacterium]
MKSFFNLFFGVQSKLTFLITLFISGKLIGSDGFGNKYYVGKARHGYNHERRWVTYKSGEPEASQVPPEYHGWLHHQTDVFPDANKASFRKSWQKPHTPNLTGTTLAYRPDGHELQKGRRARATGDYEAWKPE